MSKFINSILLRDKNSSLEFIKISCSLTLMLVLFFTLLISPSTQASVVIQNDDVVKIDKLLQRADEYKFKNDSESFEKVKQAELLAKNQDNDKKLGEVFTMYAIIYYVKGNYQLSLEKYLQAIPIHEKYNNDKFLARSLNGVALIQSGFNQLQEAVKTFEKCLAIEVNNKNYAGIARTHFNISLVQIELTEYEKATSSLKKSLLASKKLRTEETNHMIECKLGDLMRLQNKPDSAFYYYNTLLKSENPVPNNWEKTYTNLGIAETYILLKEHDKAEKYALLSYQLAQENNVEADIARITKVLSNIYEIKGNAAEAFKYLKISNNLSDNIYNEKKLNDINYLQLKSKEIENLKLISNSEKTKIVEKRNQIIIYSFVVLTLLLIGSLYLVRRNARLQNSFNQKLHLKNVDIESQQKLITRQNQDLMALNESKNQLFSIISHDLRTPINSIIQTLELQKNNSFSPEMETEIFEQLHLQTQSTSKMLNQLLDWANTQMDGQKINFEEIEIISLIESIVDFYNMEISNKKINLIHDASEHILFIKADIAQVRIIIQNILANAIKFTPQNGTINLNYSQTSNFINVHIINSGRKISRERTKQILNMNKRLTSEDGTAFEEGTGLGLLLVKQFLANNKGMLDLKSTEEFGTEFIISFLKN